MKDERKTKVQLINDLKKLRRQISKLQKSNSTKIDKEWALHNSKEFNCAVIENSPLGISVRNSRGKLLSVNSAWKKIWDLTDEQVNELMKADPEKPNFDNTRQSLGKWLPRVEKIYKNGGFLHIPRIFLIDKQSNRSCWVSLTYYAINDEKDDVDRVVILTDDITRRVDLEREQLESQSKYRSVIDNANIGIMVIQDNHMVFCNSQMHEMFGYKDGEYKKIDFLSVVHPDYKSAVVERIKARLTGTDKTLKPLEIKAICKSGELKWIETNSTPIQWENRPALQAFVSDITNRKQAEENLSRQKQRLDYILQGTNVGTWEWNIQTGETAFNERWANIIGFTLNELAPVSIDTWMKFVHPDDLKVSDELLEKHFKGEFDYYECEVRMRHKNGDWVWVLDRGKVVTWTEDGKPLLMCGTHADITERKQSEENLQRYECIVSSSNDMLALLDKNFVYLAANDKYIKGFGVTKSELIGSTVSEIFGNELFKSVIRPNAENCLQGHEVHYQDWFDFPKYGKRYMEITYDPYRDSDNKISGFVVNGRDITERKQAQEEMKRSEDKYRSLFDLSGDAIMLLRDGKFINCNQATLKLFGCASEQEFCKFHPADISPKLQPCGTDSKILANKQIAKAFENGYNRFEWMHQDLAGEEFPVEVMLSAINLDGRPVIQAIVRDITERKQADEELRKLAEVVKHSSELVNMADLNGNMIFLNKAGAEMLGIDSDNIQNTNIMEVIPENWLKVVQDELLPALMNGEHWNGDLQYRNLKTGELTDVHATTFTVRDSKTGKPKFLANVSLDITETKRLREQESRALRLESAGRVAGQIAHDFNNLLAPLVAYPDFIRDALPENHPTLKYVNDMEKSANQIAEINQQLLTLSRRGHYNQEVLNLNDVIQFAIGEIGILPRTIVIETDFAENLMNVRGGGSQIHRIFSNLIHNARDSMQDIGNISIKTENYYVDNLKINFAHIPKGEYIKVTISDTGCGIPENIRLNIFDPFFTTKLSDNKRGSGLGLSVVDAVMKDHDGFIDLQSTPGEGTSFYLYFPITRESIDTVAEDEIVGGTESILVVDDDKAQCDVAMKLLEKLGYSATALNSGEKAVKYLKNNPQDLLLLDMIMPDGIDGTETFRQVLKICPNQKAIIISGYAESARVEEARQLGIDMYIRKPLTLKLIAPCLRKILDKKEVLANTV